MGVLPGAMLAYETWGELNAAKDNADLRRACAHGRQPRVGPRRARPPHRRLVERDGGPRQAH